MLTARNVGTVLIAGAAACCTSDRITVTVQQSAASLAVAPASASLMRGQSMRLNATVRDATGRVINRGSVTWRTSNPAVAQVSADGTVIGEGTGTASIIASSGGRTGTTRISVHPSTPGTGRWPNEPVGNALAVDEAFDVRSLTTQPAGWWEWGDDSRTTSAIQITPGADGTAMRWIYTAGGRGGVSPGRAVIASTAMRFRSFYVGIRVRWSQPWTEHTSGANKILYWGSVEARQKLGHGPTQFYLNRRGDMIDLTLQHAQVDGQLNVPSSTANRLASTSVDDGQWHQIEIVLDGNDAGRANCRTRVWVDGRLNFDIADLVCGTDQAIFYGINLDPIWGGVGESKPQMEWLELDHLRVSGR